MCVLSNRTTGWEGNRSGYKRAVPGILVMIGLFCLAAQGNLSTICGLHQGQCLLVKCFIFLQDVITRGNSDGYMGSLLFFTSIANLFKIIVDNPIILELFFHMSKKSELNFYTYF